MDKSYEYRISSILSLLNNVVAVFEVTYRGLIYVKGIVTLFLPPRAEQTIIASKDSVHLRFGEVSISN
jgi:hypothetical protein